MCLVAYSQMLFTKAGPFPAVIFEPNPYYALRKPLPFIFKPTCGAGKQRLWTAVLAFVVREREALCAAWHGGLARILRSEAAECSSLGWFLLAFLEIREIDIGNGAFCYFLAPSPHLLKTEISTAHQKVSDRCRGRTCTICCGVLASTSCSLVRLVEFPDIMLFPHIFMADTT